MPVARIDDPRRVLASIALEPERSALLAAILGGFGAGDAAWAWRAGGATNIAFVVLLARTPFGPSLFGYGFPAGVDNLLHAALPELPESLRLHFPTEHREPLDRLFTSQLVPHRVSAIALADLAEPDERVKPIALGDSDAAEVGAFVAARGEPALAPDELRAGLHLGLRDGGRLVALASAPVVAPAFRRAFVARLAAPPGRRGRAAAAALHFALARRLLDEGIEFAAHQCPESDATACALSKSLGYHAQYHALFGPGRLRGTREGPREAAPHAPAGPPNRRSA